METGVAQPRGRDQHSQCSALIISWKSCLVFFFMMDSQAPISAEPRDSCLGEVMGSTRSLCPSSPTDTCVNLCCLNPAGVTCPSWGQAGPPTPPLSIQPPRQPVLTPPSGPTQTQQPMLLLQPLQLLGHKVLHLFDVHATAPLRRQSMWEVTQLHRDGTVGTHTPGDTHVILCLQVPRLLAQEAKHAGEVLVTDLAEDLQSPQQPVLSTPHGSASPGTAALAADALQEPEQERDEAVSP